MTLGILLLLWPLVAPFVRRRATPTNSFMNERKRMSKIYSGVLAMQRPRSRRMDQFGSRDHGQRKAILTGRVGIEKRSATARCHANGGGRATTVVASSTGSPSISTTSASVICSTAFNSSANGAKVILRNVGYWHIPAVRAS